MNFPNRLTTIRKSLGLTRQALAEAAEIHINQIRRYESGTAQPILEGMIKLAKTLQISLDELVFDPTIRDPDSGRMKFIFDAVERLSEAEQNIIRELLEGMIVKCTTRRIKTGSLVYDYHRKTRHPPQATVPWLQLKGHWLARAGFGVNTPVIVRVMERCLVLTAEQ